MAAMEDELKTIDFLTIDKRLERLAVDVKKMKVKELQEELELLQKLKAFLEAGKPLREYPFTEKEDRAGARLQVPFGQAPAQPDQRR